MNPDHRSRVFTLDWDDITSDELQRRLDFMEETLTTLRRFTVSLSPCSGYHINIECFGLVNVANMRNYYKDDGARLINDILNRPHHIHDILWTRKISHGTVYRATPLYSKVPKAFYGKANKSRKHNSGDICSYGNPMRDGRF